MTRYIGKTLAKGYDSRELTVGFLVSSDRWYRYEKIWFAEKRIEVNNTAPVMLDNPVPYTLAILPPEKNNNKKMCNPM